MRGQRAPFRLVTVLGALVVASALWAQRPQVEIRTDLGTLVVELYNETPQHRDNFLKLVKEGYYDSLLFHRVIPEFMVQGGDPDSRNAPTGKALGTGGPKETIPAEIIPGVLHKKGALAAARQPDQVNPEKRSSGSQFYIVQGRTFAPLDVERIAERSARMGTPLTYTEADQRIYSTLGGAPHLDGGYTVFGEVVEGLEVIDAIAAMPCDGQDRPLKDVRMFMRVVK